MKRRRGRVLRRRSSCTRTGPAAYGYQVVRNSNFRQEALARRCRQRQVHGPRRGVDVARHREGFVPSALISTTSSRRKAAANKPGFKAVEMSGETLHSRCAFAPSTISNNSQRCRHHSGIQASAGRLPRSPAHWGLTSARQGRGARRGQNLSTARSTTVWAHRWCFELAEKFARREAPATAPSRSLFWTLMPQWLAGLRSISRSIRSGRANHIALACLNTDADGPKGPAHEPRRSAATASPNLRTMSAPH